MDEGATSIAAGRAKLVERRAAAEERVSEIERKQREAGQAREQARHALVQAEREGVDQTQRSKLEKALTAAEARFAERWQERIAGARAAVGDAQAAIRDYTAEHLDELVDDIVRQGEAAAEAVNAAAQSLVDAHAQWNAVHGELTQVIYSAGVRIQPTDTSRSRSDEATQAASRLLGQGGEEGPRLLRDPRIPTHGMPVETSAA